MINKQRPLIPIDTKKVYDLAEALLAGNAPNATPDENTTRSAKSSFVADTIRVSRLIGRFALFGSLYFLASR